MTKNFGLTYSEIDESHTINPEVAAHNIALAYVGSSAKTENISNGEDVVLSDVLSLSNQYAEAYNYAYNFIAHTNKLTNEVE